MSLGAWFRRTFRGERQPVPQSSTAAEEASGSERGLATAAFDPELEAIFEALSPPADIHDSNAWDDYWNNHLKFGQMDIKLNDFMASDTTLPALFLKRGVRKVLCVGGGLSSEPVSLALHGLDVTALDISAVPAAIFAQQMRRPDFRMNRIPGVVTREDGSVSINSSDLIDPDLCPQIHRSADCPNRGGGALSFVTGDLTNRNVCSGPYDAVIERRTVQLFQGPAQLAALDRLIARLGTPGVFVSHVHNGRWKPGEDLTHYAESWLAAHGFVIHSGRSADKHASIQRLAYLVLSTG